MGADFLHSENGLPSRQQNPDSNARMTARHQTVQCTSALTMLESPVLCETENS